MIDKERLAAIAARSEEVVNSWHTVWRGGEVPPHLRDAKIIDPVDLLWLIAKLRECDARAERAEKVVALYLATGERSASEEVPFLRRLAEFAATNNRRRGDIYNALADALEEYAKEGA